ncbi:glycosyltransferase [Rhizobium sp. RU36D]|uniref:glycosyltransferase family 2 protein n=1 Tax=Rhizobium sp. RU36D TaxID=1907415 RepID=UPI0009D867F3|nr:glycosyltransferase [Rhizobium sp. RU36D]SMD11261.1 Glycosyltransferase, GT2 family [Rhizobium sp. RU36D]
MSISLITSTLGRRDVLDRLLTSLERQSVRDFEIVVVDQNPEGFLSEVLAAHAGKINIKHIRSPKGVSRGRNAGLKVASGDIIGFPDDDCWHRPEGLADVVSLFAQHPDHGMILGRTVDQHGNNSVVPSLDVDCDINRSNVIDAANTNTIFVRREAADLIGSFDENLGPGSSSMFQGAEDRDYVARALAVGIRVRFAHDLTIFHEQVDTSSETNHLARIRKYSMGDGAFYRKHHYGLTRIALMTAKTIGGIPLRLLRGQAPELMFKFTYCMSLISGYLHWVGEL